MMRGEIVVQSRGIGRRKRHMVQPADGVRGRQRQHLDELLLAESIDGPLRILRIGLLRRPKLVRVKVLRCHRIAGVDGHVRDARDLRTLLSAGNRPNSDKIRKYRQRHKNTKPKPSHMHKTAFSQHRHRDRSKWNDPLSSARRVKQSSRKIVIPAGATSPAPLPESSLARAARANSARRSAWPAARRLHPAAAGSDATEAA